MNKVWIIAQREYLVNVRRVGFLLFTFGIPFIGLIILLGGAFFSGSVSNFFDEQFSNGRDEADIVGIVDEAALLTPLLPDYAERYRLYTSEETAQAALRTEELVAVALLPADYMTSGHVTMITVESGGGIQGLTPISNEEMRDLLRAHLLRDQPDAQLRDRLLNPFDPTRITLPANQTTTAESTTAESEAVAISGIMFGYFFGIMLGIAVFTSAGYLLQGVARDKGDRIVEILLSSVSARQLLAGKVLGLGALGLTQLIVWIGSLLLLSLVGTTVLGVTPAAFRFLFARPEFLLLDILYFLLGFLLYALLMGSVGALGTSQQESQQMAGIFTFLAVIPFMLGSFFISNPDSTIVRVLSWFPITAPTAMLLRLPLTVSLPWIDIVISLSGLVITISFAVWFGGKIFRLGLLIYGQRPSFGRVWKMLREA